MKNRNLKLIFKWNIIILLILAFVAKVEANTSINNILQQNTVSGVVTAANGEPLPYVNVSIEGTTIGVTTDLDGKFTLNANGENRITLVASYIGFITFRKEIDFSTNQNQILNIVLKEDVMSLSEVLITGNANARTKLESSVAITTIKPKEIEQRVPRSSIDLLKAVPGLWVESTGGEGPASIRVRGFVSGGFTFVGLMEDGLPIFQGGYNTIPSPDQFYKTDLNLKTMEAIRGGTAPIVMQGVAGAVINNISKVGTDVFKGVAKFSYNPVQNMERLDLNVGGPITEGLNYNIGGFLRTGRGAYNADYAFNKGGQLKGNIIKHFKNGNGFLKVYGKYINDRVNWNLPSPYIFHADGSLGEIPGFDLKKDGASIGKADTELNYTLPGGEVVKRDLKDGFYTNLLSFGFEYEQELGNNWKLNNKFRIDGITHNNDADLSVGIAPLDPNTPYFYTDGTQISDVTNLNGNGLSLPTVLFNVDNEYDNIINRLEIKKISEKNSLLIGLEYFNYKQKSKSSQILTLKEITNQPRILVPEVPGSGLTPIALFSPSGISRTSGEESTYSIWLSDELEVSDNFRIDMGFRLDNKHINATIATKEGTPVFVGGPGFTFGDDFSIQDDAINWAASVGLNYKLNRKTALFARGSRAYNGIKLGDYTIDGADIDELKSIEDRIIYQMETGVKYGSSNFTLFGSLLYAKVNNIIGGVYVPATDGTLIQQSTLLSSRTISAEIEAMYKLNKNFNFKWTTTIQDAEYTDYTFVGAPGTIVEGQEFDWSGNTAERAPSFISDLTGSFSNKKINAFLSFRYYSSRWSTAANNVKISAFSEFYAGAGYNFTKKLRFNVSAANLFNTVALTEGNTRGDQFVDPNDIDGTNSLGRRTFPFSVFTSLTYNF
ncbi:MAG: hypothetical protein DRJ10_02595 [Bacteroidetes bacterium]|nr:MAG: hypothetical protein DRJ10_02595 [Bacteroidota bacterium]